MPRPHPHRYRRAGAIFRRMGIQAADDGTIGQGYLVEVKGAAKLPPDNDAAARRGGNAIQAIRPRHYLQPAIAGSRRPRQGAKGRSYPPPFPLGRQEIGGPHKLGHKTAGRAMKNLLRLPLLLHPPPAHYHHPVAHIHCLLLVMGNQNGGNAMFPQNGHHFPAHLFPQAGVQTGKGLVQ